ncbi:MAG: hypothetical protein Q7S87_19320, partial [Agitococcus sp.]|nr:hypothetical protein [Agitococcus sp.]
TVVMGVHPSTSVGVVSTAVHHVTNSGTGTIKDMTATIATAGSLFTVTANTCPAILAPLGECDVTTSITPVTAGVTYTDSLNLNYFGLVTQGALSLVPGSSPVKMLVQDQGQSYFYIGTDNVLYGTGANGQGQLGTGNSTSGTSFQPLLTNVAQASSGYQGTLALRTDGTVKGTGMAQLYGYGGVYLYTFRDPATPVTNLRKVVAGLNAGYYLKNDDTLWITGTNSTLGNAYALRQLATGVADVSVTSETILILKTDGTVWSAGSNNWGQLGIGTVLDRTSFTQVMTGGQSISAGQYITSVIKTDGTLWTSGYSGGGGPPYPYSSTFQQKLSGVSSVAAAGYRVLALKTDGTLWFSTTTGSFIQKETGVRQITSCLVLKFDNSIWNECLAPAVKVH